MIGWWNQRSRERTMTFGVFTEEELEALYFVARGGTSEIWKYARKQIVDEIKRRNALQGIQKD